MPWGCGIDTCDQEFERVEDLIVHQTDDHERTECQVCGAVVPDGYLAIRHAVEKHSRAEYVRAYEADAEDVREREEIKSLVEKQADLGEVVDRIDEDRIQQNAD